MNQSNTTLVARLRLLAMLAPGDVLSEEHVQTIKEASEMFDEAEWAIIFNEMGDC